MATVAFFSQHSSNPLEVASSDRRNNRYTNGYRRAKAEAAAYKDSDAPGTGGVRAYQSHLDSLYKQRGTPRQDSYKENPDALIDLDEEMASDEEEPGDGEGGVEVVDEGEEVEEVEDDIGSSDIEIIDAEDDEEEDEEEQEEHSILQKSRDEQEEIRHQIADLETAVPELVEDYKIVDRLGTGTFSCVFKAVDLGYHTKWDNTVWHGCHPPPSSAYYQSIPRPSGSKVFVAIKRIYVTSTPERIRNEIMIMETCRGARHVSQIITAFRKEDQVVVIMPYQRNDDFRDFHRVLPIEGVKQYFRCMFRALRDIHARGIIHRDVKPANFLFDPRTGIGTLCDFGLACRMEKGPKFGICLHTAPSKSHPHGRIRRQGEIDANQIRTMQKEARQRSTWPSEKVGRPEKDVRPHAKANRAGTRGFRAPEVLLKCGEQTGAIDVWSAGTILCFFLTGKFPLFTSSDDVEALMEITTIIGRKKMEKTATLHSRTFTCNIPTLSHEGLPWSNFAERLNPKIRERPPPDPRFYPYYEQSRGPAVPPPSSSSEAHRTSPASSDSIFMTSPRPLTDDSYAEDIDNALDLLDKIMHPESIKRYTPRQALYHPFLREEGEGMADDEFFPHPFGEGVCGEWHLVDDQTEELCVRIRVDDDEVGSEDEENAEDHEPGTVIRKVAAGECIAIGNKPCVLHQNEPRFYEEEA